MARKGYIDARNAVEAALKNVEQRQADLRRIEEWNVGGIPAPEELKNMRRPDLQKELDFAQSLVAKARQDFAKFERKKGEPRIYFDVDKTIHVSFSRTLYDAIAIKRQTEGISLAELIRRALSSYLGVTEK